MKKHASGAEKRRMKSNIQAYISKPPKISDFFGNDCEDTSSQEIDQQNPEEAQDVILLPQSQNKILEPPVPIATQLDIRTPSNDPALGDLDSELIKYWVKFGPQTCRNVTELCKFRTADMWQKQVRAMCAQAFNVRKILFLFVYKIKYHPKR